VCTDRFHSLNSIIFSFQVSTDEMMSYQVWVPRSYVSTCCEMSVNCVDYIRCDTLAVDVPS